MKIAPWKITLSIILCIMTPAVFAGVGGYKKATEGDDVIKNKAYPKKGRVELNGPNVGLIMNQSYVNTYLINGGINYFWSESWGLGLEGYYALNSDKDERKCIENFYNNPDYDSSLPQCGSPEKLAGTRANYGPAYVNIREYNYLLAANGIWNPIYGKEIFFMSGVVNFDIFVTVGGGLAFSTFYPLTTTLGNGKPSRGQFPGKDTTGDTPGTDPNTDGDAYYGVNGRPVAQKQTNVFLDGGFGQKIHFGEKFNLKAELRSHLVLGTPGGFDMFFSLWGGFGMRF